MELLLNFFRIQIHQWKLYMSATFKVIGSQRHPVQNVTLKMLFFGPFLDVLVIFQRYDIGLGSQCYLYYLSKCLWFCGYSHFSHSSIGHRVIIFQKWCYHPTSEMTHYRRMAHLPLLNDIIFFVKYHLHKHQCRLKTVSPSVMTNVKLPMTSVQPF